MGDRLTSIVLDVLSRPVDLLFNFERATLSSWSVNGRERLSALLLLIWVLTSSSISFSSSLTEVEGVSEVGRGQKRLRKRSAFMSLSNILIWLSSFKG